MEDEGEVIVGAFLLLRDLPGLAQRLLGHLLESLPLAVALEPQLVVGHEVALRAVAEAGLHEPQDGRVDMLAVARHAADVEDDGDRLHLLGERGPRVDELLPSGRVIALEEGGGEGLAVGEHHAVEREPEELGEARLAGAVEAGDPRRRKLGAPLLLQLLGDAPEEVDELLVDARLHPARTRVVVGIAPRDDVLADLRVRAWRALCSWK